MRLTERWRTGRGPTISFELFPARNDKAAGKLEKVIDELAGLGPDFVSVTFGAGGSTREGSRQLVKKLRDKDLVVLGYVACIGLPPEQLEAIVADYEGLGVENLLAVRGDAPSADDYRPHPQAFSHASDFVAFLRPRTTACLGVAGYPEGHVEAKSREEDLGFLKQKVDQGADYVIAQYTYRTDAFFDFRDRCLELGISVPIVPGVMPIYSQKMTYNLAEMCGASIPDHLRRRLDGLPEGDQAAVLDLGVEVAVEQCRQLLRAGVPGIHFYSMDRSASLARIVKQLRDEGLGA